MKLFFIRHGETEWNKQKRFQGRTDIALSKKGIGEVSKWRIPDNIEHWFISPLGRTRQTAAIHNLEPLTIIDDLIEASWGKWEGKILKELRKKNPHSIASIESQGLDMRPPDGETPREVRSRLMRWLNSISVSYHNIGIISHRGVIRAALSQATDWDMKSDHSLNITHNNAYEFSWTDGKLSYVAEHGLIHNENN